MRILVFIAAAQVASLALGWIGLGIMIHATIHVAHVTAGEFGACLVLIGYTSANELRYWWEKRVAALEKQIEAGP